MICLISPNPLCPVKLHKCRAVNCTILSWFRICIHTFLNLSLAEQKYIDHWPSTSVGHASKGLCTNCENCTRHHQNVNVMKLVLKNHWLYQRECFTKYFWIQNSFQEWNNRLQNSKFLEIVNCVKVMIMSISFVPKGLLFLELKMNLCEDAKLEVM